ncbi:hypothetical protein C4K14_2143 [Pseudomonas chlororaphis subsp. aureofaciens]|nr:hypothetical protein [Pseudomonas chlororaphis]AZD84977.1 hypothetical protein C4K14_2143 [Pseudomonas chlororaphis subsp. aureofaciens]
MTQDQRNRRRGIHRAFVLVACIFYVVVLGGPAIYYLISQW